MIPRARFKVSRVMLKGGLHNSERCWSLCRGCHEEALKSYEAALQADPDDAKAYFRMGVTLFALQRFLPAEAAYFDAIRVGSWVFVLHMMMSVSSCTAKKSQFR